MSESKSIKRREFFKQTAAVSGSLLLVKPETAFSAQANSQLTIGLLGCGGRGTAVAADFVRAAGCQVTVLGDVFQDQLDRAKDNFTRLQRQAGRPGPETTFLGPDAYREVANSDVDIFMITSPPYFHPQHLEAGLEAGKHIYLEKPVATDVAGCKKVMELAKEAEGKVSVDVGFQIRRGPLFRELTRRLQEGAIGEIATVQGFYLASDLPRRGGPDMSPAEAKLRNWPFYRVLAGDIILEQNVHIMDVFNWVLQSHPVRAEAHASREVRDDIGDVNDNYMVTFWYPNDLRASFMSTQFLPEWGTVGWRFFGPDGFSEAFYSRGLRIIGKNPWEAEAAETPSGEAPEVDPLADATPEKAKAFVASIENGRFHNELVQGTESCLSAILARQSAYYDEPVTWDEMMASNQSWTSDLDLDDL